MCCVMPPASEDATSVLADRVEQRGLAVIDVPHDRHDRRALAEVRLGVLELRLLGDIVGGVDDLHPLVEFLGEERDRLVGERLRQRRHLAERHQAFDDLGHRHIEVLGDVLDGRAGVDPDGSLGDAHVGALQRRDGFLVGSAAAPSAARPPRWRLGGSALLASRGLRVDHDATPAAGTDAAGRTLTGARIARRACRMTGRGRSGIAVRRRAALARGARRGGRRR